MRSVLMTLFVSLIIITPTLLLAQGEPVEYRPIVGIPGYEPGSTDPDDSGFGALVNSLYALSISLAALLAVIKIIIAGVKWMLTDVVTQKSEAKKDIEGALLGLLLIIAAVLILTTINAQLIITEPVIPS